jgi:uncharacterized protein
MGAYGASGALTAALYVTTELPERGATGDNGVERHRSHVKIAYDAAKRAWTLDHRGLDFEDAGEVFASLEFTVEDDRRDYGETRFTTYGLLGERLVVLIWTPRDEARHIISMRKANEREKRRYESRMG